VTAVLFFTTGNDKGIARFKPSETFLEFGTAIPRLAGCLLRIDLLAATGGQPVHLSIVILIKGTDPA
jgi:hypothetical protein